MKPIETVYKNYRFRSRLEARWAVFFDTMNIEWEYEVEGFILDDGTYYLPDFWLPQKGAFVEVKASCFLADERKKCELLAKHKPVILALGIPECKPYERILTLSWPKFINDDLDFLVDKDGNVVEEDELTFMDYYFNETRLFEIIREETGSEFNLQYEIAGVTNVTESSLMDFALKQSFVEFQAACTRAKQARFEHGENGWLRVH